MADKPTFNQTPQNMSREESSPESFEQHSNRSPIPFLVEFKRRRQAGEPISALQFLTEARVQHDPETIVDIVFAEFLEAERKGESGVSDRLCDQFPDYAKEIRQQIYFHRLLVASDKAQPVEGDFVTARDRKFDTRSSFESQDLGQKTKIALPGLEVLKPIGRGGMGVVYLAHEPKLNRKVAVKLLLDGAFASPSHRARFHGEAQAAAAIRHANIVQIDEVGESDGQPYIVMEYVDGGTLEQFIKQQQPTPREAAAFVQTLAGAVHYAHLQGIIHRDLKPGNILLSPKIRNAESNVASSEASRLSDWNPKITDFGLAKILGEQQLSGPALTMAGDMLGTPSYMAPEQASNQSAGAWTDVYSLGAILYQLLSGRPPFLAATPWETLQQALTEEPQSLPRSVPRNLRTICMKCLRKAPSARYTSTNMLASELERFLAGKPIAAQPSTVWERTASWCRRNKVVTVLGSSLIVALMTILGLSLWSRYQLSASLDDMQLARRNEAKSHAESMNYLVDSLISEAKAHQSTGRIGQRVNAISAIKSAEGLIGKVGGSTERTAALRDIAAGCMALPDLVQGPVWNGPPFTHGSCVSTDNRFNRVAQLINNRVVLVTEQLGAKAIFEIRTEADHIVISPDGNWLAAWGRECNVYDLRKSSAVLVASYPSGGWWGFSPASDKLVGADNTGMLIIDLNSQAILHRLPNLKSIVPLAFSKDHQKVALMNEVSVMVCDLTTGSLLCKLESPDVYYDSSCLAWHPDSERLAVAKYLDETAALWNTKTKKVVRRYPVLGFYNNIRISDSGHELIVGSEWGGNLSVFDVESELELLSTQARVLGAITSGPTATRIWTQAPNGGMQAWDFISQDVVRQFKTEILSESKRMIAACDREGRWLAVSSERGFELFDARTKNRVAELRIGQPAFDRVYFDSFGRVWTIVSGGCIRWKIGESGASAPQFLPASIGFQPICVNHDGSWILSTNSDELKIESTGTPNREIKLGRHYDVRNAAFSPDSRLVATGTWNGAEGVKIWNVETCKLENHLEVGSHCELQFSPDGQWLLTTPRGGEVWNARNWKLEMRLESPDTTISGFAFAFSPDSKLVANSASNGLVKLWDIEKRQPIITLRDPSQHRAHSLLFLKERSQLVCVTKDRSTMVKHWDLAKLAKELSSMQIETSTLLTRADTIGDSSAAKDESLTGNSAGDSAGEFNVGVNALYVQLVAAQIHREFVLAVDSQDWMRVSQLVQVILEHSGKLPSFVWALARSVF